MKENHDLKSYIRDVKDFPKPGIMFKDITTLLKDKFAFQKASQALYEQCKALHIDKVAGIESRGFIFGTLLAQKLQAGFVPVRKPGKLPFDKLSETYALEYGRDELEIHIDGIQNGERVLIHDDVLATGGTAFATCKLVEKAGGEVVQVSFLIELAFLNGRDKLSGYPIASLLQY